MRRTPSSASVRSGLAMVVMCLALAAFVALAAPAHAADPPPHTISGIVTDAGNGVPIPSVAVELWHWDGGAWNWYNDTRTDYDGAYAFGSLPDGTYRVEFHDDNYYLYVGAFWDGATTLGAADDIVVTGDTGVSSIDAALVRQTGTGHGSSISGRITGSDTGWGIGTAPLTLYYDDAGTWYYSGAGNTGADGRYLFTGLSADEYTFYVYDWTGQYREAHYLSRADLNSADSVTVGEDADVTGIDQPLDPIPSAISGTVTDEATSDPIEAISVYLYRSDGSGGWNHHSSYLTGADGRYHFGSLPAGDYRLNYYDGNDRYFNEFWENATELSLATSITLDGTTSIVTGIDAELARAGTISGAVTAEGTGDPLTNASVVAYRYNDAADSWDWANSGSTDVNGEYELSTLPYGTYRLHFTDWGYVYLPEYYDNATGLLDATDIAVGPTPVSGINAALARGGRISGYVTDADSYAPVEHAQISAYRYDPTTTSWQVQSSSAQTGADGSFTLGGLPFGTYRFFVSASGFAPEYWQDATSVDDGTSREIVDDMLLTGLDFEITRTGSVSGTVTDLGTTPLQNVQVQLFQLRANGDGTPYWSGTAISTNTGVDGTYTLANVPPGMYRVRFYDQNAMAPYYQLEYYAEKTNAWVADDVAVGAGQAVTGINAHMSAGASISGTVRDTGSSPLQSVAVRAFVYNPADDDWEGVGTTAYTDSSGDYTIVDLPDDTYRLGFSKSGYVSEYYNDASNVFEASDVAIVGGVSVSGRDVTLAAGSPPPGGTLNGTVIADTGGSGIAGVRVIAWRSDPIVYGGWYWATSTMTNASGAYAMSAATGVYRLQFRDESGLYLSEYYDDRATAAAADHLVLGSGATVTSDAGLADAATIAGTVTGEDTGLGIEYATVNVWARSGLDWYRAASTTADEHGVYLAGGLPMGSYRVEYQDNTGGHIREFYDDRPTVWDATPLLLDAGDHATGIDASLKAYGSIVGTVTGDDGRPVDGFRATAVRRYPDYWATYSDTVTNPDGTYRIGGLPPGTYAVHFSDNAGYGFDRYEAEYHSNATRVSDATPISIGYGETTVNGQLVSTGTWGDIAGRATDDVSGMPVPNIAIRRHDPDGGGGWYDSGHGTHTAADGTYTLQWVPVGSDYRVAVDPSIEVEGATSWTGIFQRTFHDDDPTADAGLPVVVAANAATPDVDIDVNPEPNVGYLSGHVIEDGTDADIAGATVTLYRDDGYWNQVASFAADATGRFMRPVTEGTYAVYLEDWPAHRAEYYEDIDSWTADDATPVVVTPAATTDLTASLEPLSSISGRVTAESGGAPLGGIWANVYQSTEGGYNWIDQAMTDSNGVYEVVGVRRDSGYLVEFSDSQGIFATELYDDQQFYYGADLLTVGATPLTGIDAALAEGASISGTVTDAATAAPVANVYVYAYRYNPHTFGWESTPQTAYTNSTGTYTISGLAADTYRVYFGASSAGYANEYHDGVYERTEATNHPLVAGQDLTGIDATLDRRGSLSGTVTDVTNGSPLSSAWVYAYRYRASDGQWSYDGGAQTSGAGTYTVADLPPGTYRVYFYRSGYVTEWRHDQYEASAAYDLTVGSDEHLTGIDEALSPGTTISGTVRTSGGSGASSVLVSALRFDPAYGVWKPATSTYTNGSGQYTLNQLGDYPYRILFRDPSERYLSEYYDDAATAEAGTPVPVAGGTPVTSIDATLAAWVDPPRGTVAGTVRDATSATPLRGIEVRVATYAPYWGGWNEIGSTTTGPDGTYSVACDIGTYRIRFEDPSGNHINECYHDADDDYWSGTDVVVNEGVTTTVNEGLQAAARIGGTVRADDGGASIAGIEVTIYRVHPEAGYDTVASDTTGSDGRFDCGGLTAGDYLVAYSDPQSRYLSEYFDDAVETYYATRITLAPAQIYADADASLATAGSIGGTVSNEANGRPIEGLLVKLWRNDGWGPYYALGAYTDESGTYLFKGLADCVCWLEFTDQDTPTGFTRFESEFFDDAADIGSAQALVVDNDHTGVDAQLTATGTWGSIAGTVTDGMNGVPVEQMPIVLYAYDGAQFVRADQYTTETGPDGAYEFPYLPELPGGAPYRVLADASMNAWSSVYAPTAHLAATTVDDGDSVYVAADTYLTGIDVYMSRLADVGWIGGVVESDETSAPLAGIQVDFYTDWGSWVGRSTTAADGSYGRALPPGDYLLEFSDPAEVYATEWHDDAAPNDATSVGLAADGSVTVDAALALAGRISGSVRNGAGDPILTWVYLYDGNGAYLGERYCENGDFTFGGLRADVYTVYAGGSDGYLGEYWNDLAVAGDPIPVAVGQHVTGIDFILSHGGTIGGTVSSDDGLLAGNVYVTYYAEGPVGWDWAASQWVYPEDGWAFESAALIPGGYRMHYWDNSSQYDATWYRATPNEDDATSVPVADDETTPVELVFDGLPPEVGTDAVASYDNVASIEITATDLTSGVRSVSYRFGGETVETTGSAATFNPSGVYGLFELEYWATDVMGHESGHQYAEFEVSDTIAPTVDSDAVASYPSTARITLTAADNAGGIGLAGISWVVDSEATATVGTAATEVLVDGIGDHAITYWATDHAGNESEHIRKEFTIADVEDPTADDDAVGTYAGTAIIHITADDNVAVDHISWRLDGGAWTEVAGAEATVTVTAVGAHTLQYQAFDATGNGSPVYSAIFTVTRTDGAAQTEIAGTNRYTTSVEISKVAFPGGSDWVVVATGNNWPDALGGSALAGALGGPILLTDTNTLPAAVSAEITRLGADRAVILGGTAAVGTPVESALKALLGAANVERLAGTNRYQTADKVGARTIAELGGAYDGTAFVSTGANYPDALGAAPLSAGLGWPLFLTKPTGLDPATRTAMTGVDHVLILGGTAVVSPAIETSLNGAYGAANVDRLSGTNRYETAVAVASYGVANGLHWNQVAIATGEKFPDALAGGVLQGLDGSVMLLTPTASLNASVRSALSTNKLVIDEVRFLGGTGAVSQTVRNGVAAALQ